MIIAIDFDGTIIESEKDYVPRKLIPLAKEVINWAHEKGCYIIVWTCRNDLKPVRNFLGENGVKYDTINENFKDLDFETSRKIFADIYIDDRALGMAIDWSNIKKEIQKLLVSKLAKYIIKGA